MISLKRFHLNFTSRNFLKLSSALSLTPALSAQAFMAKGKSSYLSENPVNFVSDGLNLSPMAYSQLLTELTKKDDLVADYYSLNGCVEVLENKMAKYIFAYTFLTESNSKNYLKHLLIFITCHTINSLSETDGGEE